MIDETQLRIDELKSIIPFVKNAQTIEQIQDALNYKIRFYESLLPEATKSGGSKADYTRQEFYDLLQQFDATKYLRDIKDKAENDELAVFKKSVFGETDIDVIFAKSNSLMVGEEKMQQCIEFANFYNTKNLLIYDEAYQAVTSQSKESLLLMHNSKSEYMEVEMLINLFKHGQGELQQYLAKFSHIFVLHSATHSIELRQFIRNAIYSKMGEDYSVVSKGTVFYIDCKTSFLHGSNEAYQNLAVVELDKLDEP